MANAQRDGNFVPGIMGMSSSDGTTPVLGYVDPTTNRQLVNATISGTINTTTGGAPDGTAFTAGSTQGSLVMGAYQSSPSALTSDSAGVIGLTANREVKVNISSGTVTIGALSAGSNTIGTVTIGALQAGSNTIGTVTIGAIQAGNNTIGTVFLGNAVPAGSNTIGTVSIQGSLTANQSVNVAQLAGTTTSVNNGTVDNGTLRVTLASNGSGQVALAAGGATVGTVSVNALPALATGSNTVGTVSLTANSGVNLAQVGGSNTSTGDGTSGAGVLRVTLANNGSGLVALNTGSATVGTVFATGNVAAATADQGNPVKVGGRATATLSTMTLYTAAQRADANSDLDGGIVVRADATLGDIVNGTAVIGNTTNTQVIAAGAAGVKIYLTSVSAANANGTSQLLNINTGTQTQWYLPVPCGTAGVTHAGVTHSFRIPLPGLAATAWNAQLSGGGGSVYISYIGFKSKV